MSGQSNLKTGITTTIDFKRLSSKIVSNEELVTLSTFIQNNKASGKLIHSLLDGIDEYNEEYDWNIGNIFQNLNPLEVIREFKKFNRVRFVNSIGLTWAFGEYGIKSETIVDYLYLVLNSSTNDIAWWRAGMSIGKIENINSVALLKSALKSRGVKPLTHYLANLDKRSSIIGVLLCSTSLSVKQQIYPKLKSVFLNDHSKLEELVNCVWLLGRLNLIDREIYARIEEIISNCMDYELIYNTFFAIQENISDKFVSLLKENCLHQDPLIRRLVARGLSNAPINDNLKILKEILLTETNENVTRELIKSIYKLENALSKNDSLLLRKYCENENGLIIDESDKWYAEPSTYNIFSEAEDPQNIYFSLVKNKLLNDGIEIENPIDLACGTGRATRQIINNFDFNGVLTAVDLNKNMIDFLEKSITRRKDYTKNIKLVESSIHQLKLDTKSNFIISTFGFPSKTFDKVNSLVELKKVHSLLDKNGVFVTVGWDETFNDELNYFWYKFLPDNLDARNFEEWRLKRINQIDSARNCGLTWFKKSLPIPLHFSSIDESAHVMGRLFGRDALEEILQHKKTQWEMSMGITYNTKDELTDIIARAER